MSASQQAPAIRVIPPDASTAPVVDPNTIHSHRRWFIGPMPEKAVLAQTVPLAVRKGVSRNTTAQGAGTGDEHPLPRSVRETAFEFFLVSGGNEAEWGEEEERHIIEELRKKWRDSEWGRILGGRESRQRKVGKERWVGSSFEVGEFLGVNILESAKAKSLKSKRSGESVAPPSDPVAGSSSATAKGGGETFVTAPSHLDQLSPDDVASASDVNASVDGESPLHSESSLSSRALLRPPIKQALPSAPQTEPVHPNPRPALDNGPRSEGNVLEQQKRNTKKAKRVRYVDSPEHERPAPPQQVLERTGSAVEATSAGASAPATQSDSDIVMSDRMLVRISYTKANGVDAFFDEAQHRTTTHLEHEDWAEFLVVWRKDRRGNHRIELYEDYTIPLKAWLLRHRRLSYVIPVRMAACQLSLYSFVDLSMCITCHPTSTSNMRVGGKALRFMERVKEGTNIFVMKPRSRTRALDWIWHLWLQLGGQIPPFLEVRYPSLDTRVKIDIPSASTVSLEALPLPDTSQTFTCENVKRLCIKVLSEIPDWCAAIDRDVSDGKGLQLAWRLGATLDWVWLEDDTTGKRRDWAVLVGLALKQLGKQCQLEIRKAEHSPSSIVDNGTRIVRPPSIEGYLDFIRPINQSKQPVYLSTHEGLLFVLAPGHAHPPSPPGANLTAGEMKECEVRRGALQIEEAYGVCDLRNVVAVRRAFQMVPTFVEHAPSGQSKARTRGVEEWANVWLAEEGLSSGGVRIAESEDEDEGGDEGLAKVVDKGRLKVRRSFELLLIGGQVFRFESYSCRVVLEWIDRLRALIPYWRQRHKVDAREEMDLAQLGSSRPRVTPKTYPYRDPNASTEPLTDPKADFPALGSIYNWCVLDGCQSVIRRGRIFTRKGLRGQYKLVELVLVGARLVQYQISSKSPLHLRWSKSINLGDAYVCSGYLAALALPKDQYNPSASPVAKRYQDGLEVDDSDEDTLFVILFRNKSPSQPGRQERGSSVNSTTPLGAKRKLVVFRTRSKLERDAWCWAINCAIEKVARQTREVGEISGLIVERR